MISEMKYETEKFDRTNRTAILKPLRYPYPLYSIFCLDVVARYFESRARDEKEIAAGTKKKINRVLTTERGGGTCHECG